MNSTERFSNRAGDYRRYRPGYPAGITELMRRECGLPPGAAVADIGSGTGIFTRVLLDAGFEVTAVEPNGPMRAAAEEDLRSNPRFHSVAAPAEKTGLPGGSFDAITVAQAFHWFDAPAARVEFRRLLRPGGWVFLIWNHRQTETNAFCRSYEELLRSLGKAYETVAHRDGEASRQSREKFFAEGSSRSARFHNPQTMDWPGLRGRFLSSSYVPAKGEARHEEMVARLEEIFRANAKADRVTFDQVAEVFYGPLN